MIADWAPRFRGFGVGIRIHLETQRYRLIDAGAKATVKFSARFGVFALSRSTH